MRYDRKFDLILAALHEVALGRAPWSRPSLLIDETLRTHGSSLLLADGDPDEDVRIHFAWTLYRGEEHPELERYYYENFYAIDERAPRMRKAPDGRLLHMRDVYTPKELKTSAAYNALRTRGRSGDGINVRLDGPRGSRITWVIHDPLDGAGWASAELDIVRSLLPHVRQTVRVQQELAGAGALGATLTELLDSTGIGIIQLDARGRIAHVNDPATHLLRAADAVLDEKGILFARTPQDNANLQRLLARALPEPGPPRDRSAREGGSMLLNREGPRPPLMLHVHPVGDHETDIGSRPVAALVLLVDPAQRIAVDPCVAAAVLGLTPTQSQIAVLMAQDIAVPEIAARLDRKIATVRSHVKSMYARLGLTRQQQLVRLVQSLARADQEEPK